MGLDAETVADSIAALTVPGVTIRTLSRVPQKIESRDCPMVYPVPNLFLLLEDAKQLTFGAGALWQYTYTMTYRYVEAIVGQDRSVAAIMPGKVSGYTRFIVAVARAAKSLGASYIRPASTPGAGVIKDASGADIQAADILLRVVEFSAD